MVVNEIYETITRVRSKCPSLIVITGGEPFRQNITPLVNLLIEAGFTVQIETNGTLKPSPNLSQYAVIVCSPKTGSVNPKMEIRANCYKYIMHADSVDKTDGLPILALNHSASPRVARARAGAPIYLQPMDNGDNKQNYLNMLAVKESCLRFNYIFQLQTHKIIGVE